MNNKISMYKFRNKDNNLIYVIIADCILSCYEIANRITYERKALKYFIQGEMNSEIYHKFLQHTDIIIHMNTKALRVLTNQNN